MTEDIVINETGKDIVTILKEAGYVVVEGAEDTKRLINYVATTKSSSNGR